MIDKQVSAPAPQKRQVRKHHWLLAGQVMFESGDAVITSTLNGVLTTDEKELKGKDISRAQQALQLNFRRRAQTGANIVDAVVLNVIYMGFWTEKEFTENLSVSG